MLGYEELTQEEEMVILKLNDALLKPNKEAIFTMVCAQTAIF